ncbi:MAG TPA: UDP-glucose 6-dehydrogenase, partial [Campylobacter avium]|nr:UDP-glucose 6-dehydrogenase [Campylobacter avium]
CRESPAIEIILKLLEKNLRIKAYDPKAMDIAKEILQDKIEYAKDMYEAIQDADVLVILTEWQSFKKLDLKKVKELMRTKLILDFRNLLDKNEAISLGFTYKGVGR